MWIYRTALKSFISCTTLTSHFPAVFYLLFAPCWQIMYFGQLPCPIFYSSKRQRYHSVVQQSKCIYYIHSSPLLSALCSTALIIQLNTRLQSHFTPTGWQDRVPEVDIQQLAQPHLYHNFAIMALHTANCPISRNCHYITKQQGIMLPQWKMWQVTANGVRDWHH